jgi:uncharacterized low-complexity protein
LPLSRLFISARPLLHRAEAGNAARNALIACTRTIVLVLSLIALAAPAQAAQKTHARHENQSLEQKCRAMVGKETVEGEGRSHMGQMQAQRFSDCMMGMPN